jgi:antitoxin YefM
MAYATFTDLRNNLATHLDKVEQDRVELVVTRQGHEPVVILPLADWEGMNETMYLLSSPANALRLRESITELDAGKGVERDLVEE